MPSILAVSEPVAAKRSLAHKLGADLVIGPATERIEELILMYSDGQGFDAVIDAAGELSAIENAVGLIDQILRSTNFSTRCSSTAAANAYEFF